MITYPNINPIAFSIGPLKVHWYGIMYLIGFACAWLLAIYRAKSAKIQLSKEQINDLIIYTAFGVIVGGRIGYILFYNLPYYFSHPLDIFKIWHGGMSFHGGVLGVCFALWLCAKKLKLSLWDLGDFLVPLAPIGLGAGRIGNFINGGLWGRVTDVPWAMVFPNAGPLPRHPSQLYEFLLEGIALFIILWFYSARPKPRMAVSAMFLLCYGIFRFIVEFFRQPDPQIGFIAWGWLTEGQLLSLPMIIFGAGLLWYAYRKNR